MRTANQAAQPAAKLAAAAMLDAPPVARNLLNLYLEQKRRTHRDRLRRIDSWSHGIHWIKIGYTFGYMILRFVAVSADFVSDSAERRQLPNCGRYDALCSLSVSSEQPKKPEKESGPRPSNFAPVK